MPLARRLGEGPSLDGRGVGLPTLAQALGLAAPKDLVVRSAASDEALLPPLCQDVRKADPEQPVSEVRNLAAIVADQTVSRSLQLRVLGAFVAITFLLAGIGIHGLLACAVSQRAREIGVRRALGAQSADILTMVLRSGVLTAAMGVAPGLALAYGAERAREALLAGVEPAMPRRSRRRRCAC